MKTLPQYHFHKTKYGEELLIDVVSLDSIRKYIVRDPIHVLSYFDITFITKGTGAFSIEDKKYTLQPGDVIFSKPGEVRSWGDVRNWDNNTIPYGFALIFEEDFLLSFFNDTSFIRNLSYFSGEHVAAKINISSIQPRIDQLLQNIITEINNCQSKDKHILRAQLYEMLMLLNREYLKTTIISGNKIQNRHIGAFISLVDKHFKTIHNTAFYADKLCITPNYLNEIVRKATGISAKAYIQNRIIREAKKQLTYTNLPVSEISDDLAFDSVSYFIRFFRNHTGLTPLQYRKEVKV
jgi:AraC-type DNA-binding domain-containing proteins